MSDASRVCCLIGCDKKATVEIYDGNERRPDCGVTDSCDDHVGHLLGSVPPTSPTGPWTVVLISEESRKLMGG